MLVSQVSHSFPMGSFVSTTPAVHVTLRSQLQQQRKHNVAQWFLFGHCVGFSVDAFPRRGRAAAGLLWI